MTDRLIINARVILASGIQPGGVLVRDGRVASVFNSADTPSGLSSKDIVDLKDEYLAPGMIDIHIHGSAGVDIQTTDVDGLAKLSKYLLGEGVTGYFPTLTPTDDARYRRSLDVIQAYAASQTGARAGARILGVHFEGPFLSRQRCGALHADQFRTYDGDRRSLALFLGRRAIGATLMTLAPEVSGGVGLLHDLLSSGARVFIGHTQADAQMLDLAFEAGARHITHYPNGLDPIHHRQPGAALWGLVRQGASLDCIADLHHVDPMMLQLMYGSKGAGRMALISDAIMPAGLGDGEFEVWGDRIKVLNGRTSLGEGPASGSLAGSVITMRQAVKNIVSIGIPLHEAVHMASLVPAQVAGIDRDYGSIEPGKRADLIAFDEEYRMQGQWGIDE